MRIVRVELGQRAYPIYIGPNAVAAFQDCNAQSGDGPQVVVIADRTVAQLHMARLRGYLPPDALLLTFPPGEASKSLREAAALYDSLAKARIERSALVVTFGGGVASDLGGFVAATWLRGVRFLAIPTTLLAAIDASVGGKTGVNLTAGKNLVGVFHQPEAVIVDTDFLQTLPERDITAGLAESIKHAAVRDAEFIAWHESQAEAILTRDADTISELIARNCEIKAGVVAWDEREAGLRAILNYGHTIGHAVEHLLGYELRHGECVALGILAENELACSRGLLPRAAADRIRKLLQRLALPLHLPRAVDAVQVVEACRLDKKVRGRAINFVLLRELGEPQRVADVSDAEIVAALDVIQPP
jgi:3-dehydroquinate synthase